MNTDALNLISEDRVFSNHLKWNAYVSKKHRLLYVATPKVACTSLKWWFAALEGYSKELNQIDDCGESDPELIVHHSHLVAPQVTGLTLAQLSEAITSDEFYRFALVRNPYNRIFSAWQSKLLLREPLQISAYRKYDFIYHPIEKMSDVAEAFELFLEHLSSVERPNYWDHHWTPQARLLRPDLLSYQRLIQVENPGELSASLSQWIGGSCDPLSGPRANEGVIPYLPELITNRSRDILQEIYSEDFDLFGYDLNPPKARVFFNSDQYSVALKAIKMIRARHAVLEARSVRLQKLLHATDDFQRSVDDMKRIISRRDEEIESLRIQLSQGEEIKRSLAEMKENAFRQEGELDRINRENSEKLGALADKDAEIERLKLKLDEREKGLLGLWRVFKK